MTIRQIPICRKAWKRGMLLGARFIKTVPLRYKFKPTSPRDADTAKSLFLVVCSVPAVCEPFGFVPSDCDIKINTIHEGWCSFSWRRKRDSNPRGFGPNGFQDFLRLIPNRPVCPQFSLILPTFKHILRNFPENCEKIARKLRETARKHNSPTAKTT